MSNRRVPVEHRVWAELPAAAGVLLAVFFCVWSPPLLAQAADAIPVVPPEQLGMRSSTLNVIDDIVNEGLAQEKMPGCVVLIGRRDGIVYHRAFGLRQTAPVQAPMLPDTVFDLASLTKPVAAATSIMSLIERGLLDAEMTAGAVIPEFAGNGKEIITIRHLLTHQSGLIPDNSISDYQNGPEDAFSRICQLKPTSPPGTKFIYSDVGFIVLGKIVERVSGMDVHQYSQKYIFQPLAMTETGYQPGDELKLRCAVTEQRDGRWMQGEVHDPRAFLLGGIAGHAGLFSTATDLARYATMMLNSGSLKDVQILRKETVDLMTGPVSVSSGIRGLGWDIRTGYSSNRGDLFSRRAFGHGGFTGTSIWIDPERDLYVIFLSNRVHPNGKGLVNPLAGRIGTIAAAAIKVAAE